MADSPLPDDLLNAFGVEVPKIGAVLDQTRQRVKSRARDALRGELGGFVPAPQRPVTPQVPRTSPRSIPPIRNDQFVTIRLRSGRRIRARLLPRVARRSDLEAIASASAENQRRAFGALEQQRSAIAALSKAQGELAGRLARLEKQADEAVLALTNDYQRSTRQLKAVAAQARQVIAKTGKAATAAAGQLQQVRALAVAQQAQNLTAVIGTAQASAYGDRGTVLSRNNLLLAGNQLLWTFVAPLSQWLGASSGTATTLGALAPLGTLLTGYAAVGSRVPEHEQPRFISGIAEFDGTKRTITVSLRDRISDDLWPRFRDRIDVPVMVMLADEVPDASRVLFTAKVKDGELQITFVSFGGFATGRKIRIAWMVDTGDDGG